MGIFDNYQKEAERVATEIAALHEKYCVDILNKHGFLQGVNDYLKDGNRGIYTDYNSYLESIGYRLEHSVNVSSTAGDRERHQWKLFKVVDTSPSYEIKRAYSIEESDHTERHYRTEGGQDE